MNILILKANASSRYANDDYKVVASLSNDSTRACPFYDDIRTEKLENFYDTYQISVPANFEESEQLDTGNYICFQDETYKYRLFKIYDVEDGLLGNIHIKTAYAENAFVDDLLKTLVPRAKIGTVNFKDAFAHCLSNSGWQVEESEYLGELINQEFDGTTTAQSEIQKICTDYRGEIDAYVKLNDANKIVAKCFDLVESRGRKNTGKRFEYKRDIVGITRKKSQSEFYTAIKAKGKDGITFADMNNGSDTIYNDAANDLYNGGREFLKKYMDYSEIEFPSALYAKTKQDLEDCSRPKFEYEIELALLDQYSGYLDESPVFLGDAVRVVDFEMKPELTVSARIIEKETSFSDPTKNKITLGEYVEIINTTPDEIKKLQSDLTDLNNSIESLYRVEIRASAGTIARNGYLQTTGNAKLEAFVYKDNIQIVGDPSQFVWEKVARKTGVHDTEWEKANFGVGSVVTVTGKDYAENYDFYCNFLDDSYNYVATTFFKAEVIRVIAKLQSLRDENYALIPFITDTHYATDAVLEPQAKVRTIDHVRNVVEITQQIDVDLVVHGGDIVDGKTTKALNMANLQAMTNELNQSDAPVMYTKGNHDDNGLGDVRNYGATGKALVRPSELSPILKDNYLRKNIEYNNDDDSICSYYDIQDKKIRAIVLDAWDIRYDLLSDDKKIKYQSRKFGGFQQKQINFLIETLSSTPTDFAIVLFVHSYLGDLEDSRSIGIINKDVVLKILNAWKSGDTYSTATDDLYIKEKNTDYPLNIDCSFADRGNGVLMGVFCGHHHKDMAKRVGLGETPTIITNTSASALDSDDKTRRKIGTANEDLFDVIALNVEKNDIQMVRFGAKFNDKEIRQYSGGNQ